ncbi:tetratricopeptide repeat protein [Pseudoalteromonas sp. G4]|uniref:tetratricopeptide repeat protein n=1 Tax=Pseudoalteromonas sp. G4 TaxID=2992761 RepID=UPI00237DC784|nr:tetratricopeptide repeat protein [Pseudoalteromonas sp. G4]MDE3272083.1 sel1 repeat family protein [Pseudoalteromonas sp. G4]
MKIRFLLFLTLLAPFISAHAQYVTELDNNCSTAFNNADFVNARYECAELSEENNGEASFILATLYAKGQGVVKNKRKALEFLILADEQGHAEASFNLALAYELGKVVGVDVEKSKRLAFEHYLKAARNGSLNAKRKIANRYSDDTSLVYEPEKAVEWLSQAVELGDEKAKLELGALYLKGEGVKRNQSQGLSLIKESADSGYDKAQFIYATLIFKNNPDEAVSYYQNAAEQGNGFAAHNLSSLYFNGEYFSQDKTKAHEYAEIAIKNGVPQAEIFLLNTANSKPKISEQPITTPSTDVESVAQLKSKNLSGFVLQFGKFSKQANARIIAQRLNAEIVESNDFYFVLTFGFDSYIAAKKKAEDLIEKHNIAMPYIRVASDFNQAKWL